ncbi:hypothetical protein [Flavobacterium sp. UGB4466]|uniref:hypothetical protein n=1 Tax=Flavobacterium sp. UGB4466 TaxID=2730889 RepID=UPI00192C53B9|nr:hypothetical protein [Flavobacterium sp. UGB4466]
MFESISKEIFEFFTTLPAFTNVMQRADINYIYPIVAPLNTSFPFTTYVLGERSPETKDKSQIVATIAFWYDVENYDACASFTDTMSDTVDDKYIFLSSSIEYNEESNTFSGVINFNVI